MANTTYYGWVKPDVGASNDVWGGLLNTDLDSIDSVVHGVQSSVAALPVAINDNRIINGDMRIDQRNNGASGTAINTYMVDRWKYQSNQTAKITWGRNLNAITGPSGFPYYLGFQSLSNYTAAVSDLFYPGQFIEADFVSDLAWGTVNAQPITLSFWAYSSLTGTFSAAINNNSNRSYPFIFSIAGANTWTKIVVTIPGDTGGTWAMSGNGQALFLLFDLGNGANYRGPAGAWASTYYGGVTGSVSVVATINATFYVTGVKLEIGSIATPFNRQSLAKSMADCQRYYQVGNTTFGLYSVAGQPVSVMATLITSMRSSPTIAFSSQSYNNCSGLTGGVWDTDHFQPTVTATTTGMLNFTAVYTASAEL